MSEYEGKYTKCIVCGKPVLNYKPEYCCNGTDCDCRGLPIEPPLCEDKKCIKKIYGKKLKEKKL